MAYLCPLCLQPLLQQQQILKCENNHQFDIAKEGYVNLMPAHHKRSKDPGDNKEMMQARRRFLEGGHYDLMRQTVAQLCSKYLQDSSYQFLDIGCGEGYYTQFVAQTLAQHSIQSVTYGLDISKIAVRYAAKRYPMVNFVVASSHRLPFDDASLAGILRIYAPCKAQELYRCIQNQGVVITVTPAARHLYQLKEGIYPNVQLHDETAEEIAGFTLVEQQKLHYTMALSGNDAFDLLQMTPFAWRASDELRAQLKQAEQFNCEADFMISVYRKVI
ncbi:23S rRNA (guanine(745)-N(1))-methyltransferase [Vibrio qinghaiensis]|jgi:23S rRNA (guanine745-N1)-methyltransferase|uniref:23S rRNA (Guanine(745)-N(1))-methyltransferase n=1 Tax=Vibrio qinghaiensis TaxID=2025808 RepID=A0A223MYG3_9VIBR|nr:MULTISPECIES: 23S rRNA (guanine(745)-N(1))-methyltransferase [Vibrio]ASU22595.1 23S rRNA (guanine(745)-N(1))-methyltransferase [Vibrio qinghaiensis]